MKLNTVVAVGVLIAVALVGLVTLNGRHTEAADPPKAIAEVGRYQLVIDTDGKKFLCDSATGRVFTRYVDPKGHVAEWQEYAPAAKPK